MGNKQYIETTDKKLSKFEIFKKDF